MVVCGKNVYTAAADFVGEIFYMVSDKINVGIKDTDSIYGNKCNASSACIVVNKNNVSSGRIKNTLGRVVVAVTCNIILFLKNIGRENFGLAETYCEILGRGIFYVVKNCFGNFGSRRPFELSLSERVDVLF